MQQRQESAAAQRTGFLKTLRDKKFEKKQGTIDFEQLKQSFQKTELNSKAKPDAPLDEKEDPLMEEEEDSEFEVEEGPKMVWDEEERVKSENEQAASGDSDMSQAEGEAHSEEDVQMEESAEAAQQSDSSLDLSDVIARRKKTD